MKSTTLKLAALMGGLLQTLYAAEAGFPNGEDAAGVGAQPTAAASEVVRDTAAAEAETASPAQLNARFKALMEGFKEADQAHFSRQLDVFRERIVLIRERLEALNHIKNDYETCLRNTLATGEVDKERELNAILTNDSFSEATKLRLIDALERAPQTNVAVTSQVLTTNLEAVNRLIAATERLLASEEKNADNMRQTLNRIEAASATVVRRVHPILLGRGFGDGFRGFAPGDVIIVGGEGSAGDGMGVVSGSEEADYDDDE